MPALDATVDKVVVTDVGALRRRYGSPGVTLIRSALRMLIEHDGARGIRAIVLDVSSRSALGPIDQPPVTRPDDHVRFRSVLDAVYDLASPDYVLLLGGPDVVPLVPLVNPMPSPDPDPDVPSDLPYACPGKAGLEAGSLVGPTRVVGRLPDVPRASGRAAAAAFAAVIRRSARWAGVAAAAFRDPLCLSTARWQLSTMATLDGLRGGAPAASAVQLAPPRAAPWTAAELISPLHLINLHGATADAHWLGDPGFAPALATGDLVSARNLRTVVIAECCFAAELWDPALAGGTLPVPLAYLAAGGYGLVGPTCVSYGGRTTPDAADVLARMVGEELLAGASLGRALLTARQRYVAEQPVMTPVDLKTLAQFSLIGDPSIQPVEVTVGGTRAERRRELTVAGARLDRTTPVTRASAAGPGRAARRSFDVAVPAPAAGAEGLPARIHVTVRRRPRTGALLVLEQREDAAGVTPYRGLESR
jgi:hypothetical protein